MVEEIRNKTRAEKVSQNREVQRLIELIRSESGPAAQLSEEFMIMLGSSDSVEEVKEKAVAAGLPATFLDAQIDVVRTERRSEEGVSSIEGEPSPTWEPNEDAGRTAGGGPRGAGEVYTEYQLRAIEAGMTEEELMEKDLIDEILGRDSQYVDQSGYLGLSALGIDPAAHAARISDDSYSIYGFTREEARSTPGLPFLSDPTLYQSGSEYAEWAAKSPLNKRYWVREMERAGLLQGGMQTSPQENWQDVPLPGYMMGMNVTDAEREAYQRQQVTDQNVTYQNAYSYGLLDEIAAYREVLAVANLTGVQPEIAVRLIRERQDNVDRQNARAAAGGGGYVKAPFSVPAALRTVPDYETLQQRVTDMMRQTLGRDPEDWEVAALADDMKEKHTQYNEQMIKAYRDAYDGKGRVEDIEYPEPMERTQRFLEERYAPEMARLEDIDDAGRSNQLMINAITKGAQMVGGV